MKNTLDEIIKKAKGSGSYFITATIREDNEKEENNLFHYTFKSDFPIDDIVPSVDHALRSMNIAPKQPVPVVKPKDIIEKKPPLKIAIITHFNRCPENFSPGRATKNLIKILQQYGHEVVFFVQEGSPLEIDCEVRPVVPKFKRLKNIINYEIKDRFIQILKRELTDDFDLIITQDLYIDDCITYREAIKQCGVNVKWLHWARSGIGRPVNFNMSNARYVYMNNHDVIRFADKIGVDYSLVRVVFNEKDPSLLWGWSPITKMISDKMRLWEKDIIQTYPLCTTRMDAKGINSVIRTFGYLKAKGNKVALIICNANGRRRLSEIESKIKLAEENGLTKDDFLFTSTLADEEFDISREVPHKVVVELMQISNLFIFPTMAEVCSNVLLEASMTKNLLVLNEDLPSLFDFADKEAVLSYPFTSLQSVHYSGRDEGPMMNLASRIEKIIKDNKADRQFRRAWKTHNMDTIYNKQLKPILYEE